MVRRMRQCHVTRTLTVLYELADSNSYCNSFLFKAHSAGTVGNCFVYLWETELVTLKAFPWQPKQTLHSYSRINYCQSTQHQACNRDVATYLCNKWFAISVAKSCHPLVFDSWGQRFINIFSNKNNAPQLNCWCPMSLCLKFTFKEDRRMCPSVRWIVFRFLGLNEAKRRYTLSSDERRLVILFLNYTQQDRQCAYERKIAARF
jgi:hypothetical protein